MGRHTPQWGRGAGLQEPYESLADDIRDAVMSLLREGEAHVAIDATENAVTIIGHGLGIVRTLRDKSATMLMCLASA